MAILLFDTTRLKEDVIMAILLFNTRLKEDVVDYGNVTVRYDTP